MKNSFYSILCCPACKKTFTFNRNAVMCKNCKKRYLFIENNILSLKENKKTNDVKISQKMWDKIYKAEKESDFLTDKMISSHTAFLRRFTKNNIKKEEIFLDLGCGIAWQSLILAKKGVTTIGMDISLEGLLHSKMLFHKYGVKGEFIHGNFLNIPLKDRSVNFIYWGLAIEYVRNTQKAVDEAYRVLKPGGTVLAPFPPVSFTTLIYHQLRGGDIPRVPIIRESMEFIHFKLLKGKYMNYGYGQTFFTNDMKKYFKNAGFKNITVGYFDTYYPLSLLPKVFVPIGQKLIRHRPFWPFAYISATK